MNWRNLYHGQCPNCETTLKHSGEWVQCTTCEWRMSSDKFFAKVRRKKTNMDRSYSGYYVVRHNSLSEQEKMLDIARVD